MPIFTQLPGVYFQTVSPRLADAMPRMDIAAFIGFATAGPFHTPVAVEDVVEFREIFVADVELGVDLESGVSEQSHLGTAVDGFFRGGGKRCWIVRAGDETVAHTHHFDAPHLHHARTLERVTIHARSAGSWASRLQVRSRLSRSRVSVRSVDLDFTGSPSSFPDSLTLRHSATEILPGELLEWTFLTRGGGSDGQLVLFSFVQSVSESERGVGVTVSRRYWFRSQETVGSPPLDSPVPIGESEAIALIGLLNSASPSDLRVRCDRIRFEIEARQSSSRTDRISDLGFSPLHPRYWKALPNDDELFADRAIADDVASDDRFANLIAETQQPRFPLSGSKADNRGQSSDEYYLPIGMPTTDSSPAFAARAPSFERLVENGLQQFAHDLFLDKALQAVPTHSLLRAAEYRRSVTNKRLRGIYSILPIEEITLLAAPDLCQRRWGRRSPDRPNLLDAPSIVELRSEGEARSVSVTWSAVVTATGYRLEVDETPDFDAPSGFEFGEQTAATIELELDCPETRYFRVRALRRDEVGPWSETRAMRLPILDFERCDHGSPLELTKPERFEVTIELVPSSPDEGSRLVWQPREPAAMGAAVELQMAHDMEFSLPRSALIDSLSLPHGLPASETVSFYRLRLGEGRPWSNTVTLLPTAEGGIAMETSGDYSDDALLTVQRSLLRLCAARQDMMAVLSLPRHYRAESAARHVQRLRPLTSRASEPINVVDGVTPLLAAEGFVLSFGAIYHPWAVSRLTSETSLTPNQTGVRFSPPDGPITGSIAEQAIREGAWIAPANQPLPGLLGIGPDFEAADWQKFLGMHINLVRDDPRGFLLLSANTLSRDSDFELINVRRLLILLRKICLRDGNVFVFEPNHFDFRNQVRHRFERILSDLYMRGAFAGRGPGSSFRVVTDESVNTRQSIERGILIVELRVAPSRPMHFLRVRLIQTGPEQLTVEES